MFRTPEVIDQFTLLSPYLLLVQGLSTILIHP